jgi:uncharacterized protein YdaU (DUF1376 family)
MSKAPPAYQYYPSDFEGGTAEWELDEVGLYTRLLNHQWIAGSIPTDQRRAASLAHTTVEVFERLWPVVGQKFEVGPDGRLRNARLEAEREKQRAWREKQVASGKKGAASRHGGKPDGKPSGDPSGEPSGDPSGEPSGKKVALHSSLFSPQSSSSVSGLRPGKPAKKRRTFLVPPQAAELAKHLRDRIQENNPQAKVTTSQLEHWGDDARLMLNSDHRDLSEVRAVIDWCQHDSFWRTNILSMAKLREKYDQLTLKMRNGGSDERKSFRQQTEDRGLRQLDEFVRGEGKGLPGPGEA